MMKKVYWIRGFPDNGVGKLIFKFPLVKLYLVKKRHGGLIFVRRIQSIEQALKDKSTISEISNTGNPALHTIYCQNLQHIKEMESFLNEKS